MKTALVIFIMLMIRTAVVHENVKFSDTLVDLPCTIHTSDSADTGSF